MIIIFVVFSFFALIFYDNHINDNQGSLFTRDKTVILKSVLPFMIIIHHTWIFEDFKCVGVFVVSLFFFISGYGQECKREIKEYFSLREILPMVRKQAIPLVIPSIIYIFLLFACQRLSIDEVIGEISGYGLILPYTWFIVSLWLLYFVFYSASSLTIRFKYVVILTAIGIAVSTVLMALGQIQSTYHMCNVIAIFRSYILSLHQTTSVEQPLY
ncbi:MAG: hypothetical protein Q4E63_05605 [Prevotellaceae bacterium]|nr:hypothetical protein [Prevotellaceae bacterium]